MILLYHESIEGLQVPSTVKPSDKIEARIGNVLDKSFDCKIVAEVAPGNHNTRARSGDKSVTDAVGAIGTQVTIGNLLLKMALNPLTAPPSATTPAVIGSSVSETSSTTVSTTAPVVTGNNATTSVSVAAAAGGESSTTTSVIAAATATSAAVAVSSASASSTSAVTPAILEQRLALFARFWRTASRACRAAAWQSWRAALKAGTVFDKTKLKNAMRKAYDLVAMVQF